MHTSSLCFYLTTLCCCVTVLVPPVTNPSGQRPYVRYSELSRCYATVRAAVLCSHKTQLHEHQTKSQHTNEKLLLAFPNDRAGSLRPTDADTEYRCAPWLQGTCFSFILQQQFDILMWYIIVVLFWFVICRTIFTGIKRYHYIDTTYGFTVEEEKQRQQHQQIYMNFISQLRQTRLQKIKERFGVSCIF